MTTTTIPVAPNTATEKEIQAAFQRLQAHAPVLARTGYQERQAKLQRLLDYVRSHQDDIEAALYQDYRRPGVETLAAEVFDLISEAKFALKHLKRWLKPQRVSTPLTLLGSSGQIRRAPKGVVLIIAPWNYPFNLVVKPLIGAIAGGNAVMIKPSEMTPHTSALVVNMVEELFPPEEVQVFEGDQQVAQALLKLPFNHIFFTGSPQVGKIVMKAAAEHLTSVTLELGGKSPCIVDESAKLKDAAERIAWGKFLNNGQTCIAPDYLLIQERVKDEFLSHLKQAVDNMYGKDAQTSDSWGRIVNIRHVERVGILLEDALKAGAKAETGGKIDPQDRFIAPTVLSGVTVEMPVMQEEIFGPVLPVLTYQHREEAVAQVRRLPLPLAMYVFCQNAKNAEFFLREIPSGDAVVNDCIIHYAHPGLPFGGQNNSGFGKSGGYATFQAFTHERSVLHQRFGTFKFIYPPYTNRVKTLMQWLMKLG